MRTGVSPAGSERGGIKHRLISKEWMIPVRVVVLVAIRSVKIALQDVV